MKEKVEAEMKAKEIETLKAQKIAEVEANK